MSQIKFYRIGDEMEKILELKDVDFTYDGYKYVLKNINLTFEKEKIYGIFGKSGAGKTTLLSLMAGLEVTTNGEVLYKGKDLKKINRDIYRSNEIGVIFKNYNLLPHLTALENVILSMDISNIKVKDRKKKAYQLLKKVGIDEVKANRRILKLSGGEQQRVAIARAISYNPEVVLADEPTGNLDHKTEKQIIDVLLNLAHQKNKCVIVVTHSKDVAENADIVYDLENYKK